MWSAATSSPPDNDSTHVLPLRLRDLSGRTPSRSHHQSIRSGITLPCVQITGVPDFSAISSIRWRAALAVLGVGLLGQRRLVADGHAEFFGQWLDRLVAANAARRRTASVAPNASS